MERVQRSAAGGAIGRKPGKPPVRPRNGVLPRKNVLVVNAYFPEVREPIKRRNEAPNALAPVLLAGHFDPRHCEIRLYNEVNSGFIEIHDPELLAWPDLIVVTGLTAAFDRLLHIAAYARSANPRVAVAAGGHGVRGLPRYSRRFFDYVCVGDVEEIEDVIRDAFGEAYVAREFTPRYDLAYWMKRIGYAESSRNCNYRCGFCSITGTGLPYRAQSLDYLDRQLEALGRRDVVFFTDNQLLGDGTKTFPDRIGRVQQRREAGQFRYWGGFVTDTFFWDDANVRLAADTGCINLFVGVESFDDTAWLNRVNKNQNARRSQIDLIRTCHDAGVLFQYGLVFDPTQRTVADMHRELDIICDTPEVPLPVVHLHVDPVSGHPVLP